MGNNSFIDEDILLKVSNVCKKKNIIRNKFGLDQVSFELPKGYILGLVGANGAGKSTFYRYIMSQKKLYDGDIIIDGKEIHDDWIWTMNNIAFISEDVDYIINASAKKNAEILGTFYKKFDIDIFESVMDRFGINSNKIVGGLSRGENIKFQMAFSMAFKPKLYLIDEATAGMDPVFKVDFYRILHEIIKEEESSIIISTHFEEEIKRHTDYIGILDKGCLIRFMENTGENIWCKVYYEKMS